MTTKASPGAFDPARHLEAMAPALGLMISEAQKPAVLQFIASHSFQSPKSMTWPSCHATSSVLTSPIVL